ncbi:hypothetical protein GCM10022223_21970 [Kineosporia mesophila]|uniref:Lipoprotein n=1 Tax=Kineosporia mesophila TaxID=566012 RepID=A0ABP6ZFW1_9ACTN
MAGCGSSSSAGTPSAATAATSAATTPAEATAGYTDAEACAWLKQNLGDLPDTEIGAMTQLTLGLSTFFEEHGGLEHADGYVLDEALTRGCPDVLAQALKKAGIKTFGNL